MTAIQPGGRLVVMAGLVLAFLLAATLFTPASAQTPSQTCSPPLKQSAGGEAITAGKILVYLPGSYHYVMNAPDVGTSGGTLRICIIEYMSQITFNTDTGAETGRVLGVPVAAEVLDLIANSARLLAPPTPTPAPTVAIAAASAPGAAGPSGRTVCSSIICPPNTGSAGLR
jgi:hypothetical protein